MQKGSTDLSMPFSTIQGNWMDFYTIVPGSPGSNFPLLLLVVILFFSWKNLCNRYTILAYAFSFSIFNGLNGLDPLYNLITASSLFSMLFLFSDPYSTPKSIRGKIFFGVIIGSQTVDSNQPITPKRWYSQF